MVELFLTGIIMLMVATGLVLILRFTASSKVDIVKKDIAGMLRMANMDYGELRDTSQSHSPQTLFSRRFKSVQIESTDEIFGPGTMRLQTLQNIYMFIPPGGWDNTRNYAPETRPPQSGTVLQIRIGSDMYCLTVTKDGNNIGEQYGPCISVLATLPPLMSESAPSAMDSY